MFCTCHITLVCFKYVNEFLSVLRRRFLQVESIWHVTFNIDKIKEHKLKRFVMTFILTYLINRFV